MELLNLFVQTTHHWAHWFLNDFLQTAGYDRQLQDARTLIVQSFYRQEEAFGCCVHAKHLREGRREVRYLLNGIVI